VVKEEQVTSTEKDQFLECTHRQDQLMAFSSHGCHGFQLAKLSWQSALVAINSFQLS
jgi:hypothetical protein